MSTENESETDPETLARHIELATDDVDDIVDQVAAISDAIPPHLHADDAVWVSSHIDSARDRVNVIIDELFILNRKVGEATVTETRENTRLNPGEGE